MLRNSLRSLCRIGKPLDYGSEEGEGRGLNLIAAAAIALARVWDVYPSANSAIAYTYVKKKREGERGGE